MHIPDLICYYIVYSSFEVNVLIFINIARRSVVVVRLSMLMLKYVYECTLNGWFFVR